MQRTAASRTVSGGSFAHLNEDLLGDETLVAYAAAGAAADGVLCQRRTSWRKRTDLRVSP